MATRKRLEDYGDVLTVSEAAELLRLGRTRCYEAINAGEIPVLRFGRRISIPREGLRLMLAGEWKPNAAERPRPPLPARSTKEQGDSE